MARFCKTCYDTKNTDIKPEGFLYDYYFENEQDMICPVCNKKIIMAHISDYELKDLMDISQDSNFIKSMDDLKRDNIIEFESRMVQFRGVQESSKKVEEDNNTPHCPYCNSTNIKKITTGSKVAHTALFGIFSMSRNSKQWHCNSCKSDF